MGDAMVGNALQSFPHISWYSIRNASDPQIPNPNDDIQQASDEAAQIYASYGGLTTAASLIATWAVIHSAQARPSAARGKSEAAPRMGASSPRTNSARLPRGR
jgi:hypothetical protein